MSRVVQMRLRKLEKRRSGLELLSDEELDSRISALTDRLIVESVEKGGPATLEEIFADDPIALSLLGAGYNGPRVCRTERSTEHPS